MSFTPTQRKRARRQARAFLKDIGVPASLKGFLILSEAIAIVAEYPDRGEVLATLFLDVCTRLKQDITYNACWRNCEKCILTAFKRCPQQKLEEYFGSVVDPEKGIITVGEFVGTAGMIIHDIIIKMREEPI